jgi:hypothetical protein
MLVGTAFASPLLISELEIRPYNAPLPKGPTADISVSAVYVNFSIGDNSEKFTDISYFVVVNITNNSDEPVEIDMVNIDVAEEITKDNSFFSSSNWTSISGREEKGAWVDGEWYNLTWVPHPQFWMNCSAMITGGEIGEGVTLGEGYWMEGVQLMEKAVGGNVTNIYMNMNGTWVDVTGRINLPPIDPPSFPSAVKTSGRIFSESKNFGNTSSSGGDETAVIGFFITDAPILFNNVWAPKESRLIALQNSGQVLSRILNTSELEQLNTGKASFRSSVSSCLPVAKGLWNSWSMEVAIQPIQLEVTGDSYVYNSILSDDEMFVMDSFGVEVFIEPRS